MLYQHRFLTKVHRGINNAESVPSVDPNSFSLIRELLHPHLTAILGNVQRLILLVKTDAIRPVAANPIGRYSKAVPTFLSSDNSRCVEGLSIETRSGADTRRNATSPKTQPIVAPRVLFAFVKATIQATIAAQKPVSTAVAKVTNRPHPF